MVRQTGTNVSVEDSRLDHNTAECNAGACGVTSNASLSLRRCELYDNQAGVICGGIASYNGASLAAAECLFVRNRALAAGAVRSYYNCPGVFRFNTFHDNESRDHGSVLIEGGAATVFEHNIVTSDRLGAGLKYVDGVGLHDCNLFFDNPNGDLVGATLAAGEIIGDPLYCNYPLDDFTLCFLSPALPANNGCGAMGAFGQGCDSCGPVSVQITTWGELKNSYR